MPRNGSPQRPIVRLLGALLLVINALAEGERCGRSLGGDLVDTVGVEDSAAKDQAEAGGGNESAADHRLRLGLSVAISVGAVALATAHLVWPDAKLDSVTLVLLAIAVLPWLGAIFKTIKLPWLEVEYWKQLQVVKARTDEIHSRLAAVETAMFRFAGTTPAQESHLDESLRVYAEYLDKLGLSWGDRDLPEVAVEPLQWEGIPGIYDPATNRIVLAPDAVENVSIVLTQYTQSVLMSYIDRSGGAHGSRKAHGMRMREIQDGLAAYLPCSHLDAPVFRRRAAQWHGPPLYPDLAVPVNFDALSTPLPSENRPEAGTAWGSLFWAIRSVIGQDKTDAILAESWVTTNSGEARDRRFVADVLNKTPPDARAAVNDLLDKRGVSR